jgi:hypothetical protein
VRRTWCSRPGWCIWIRRPRCLRPWWRGGRGSSGPGCWPRAPSGSGCGWCGGSRSSLNGTRIGDCCYLHPHERCSACGLGRAVSPYKTPEATCAACASAPLAACSSCGLDAMAPQPGEAPLCLRCASGATRPCASCHAPTVSRDAGGEPRCPGCYSRPRRACGWCGRVRVIVRLAAGEDPELCGSCWTGPVTRCATCRRQRPCRGERSGQMLCRSCQPRPKRECGYCGHRRKVTVVWRDGPACASCYRAAMRAKGDCPGCGQHRRLLPRRGTRQDLCAGCAGAPPGPVCGGCGNEDWLYHKGRCARCVLTTRLDGLLGSEAARTTRGLQPLHAALLAAERPEAVISWLQPSRPGYRILARLASGELDLSHPALDAVADVHRNATGHIASLLTALGTLPRRDTHLACLERDIAAILDGAADQDMRRLLRRYATWGLLRHARAKARQAPLTSGIRHGQTARLKTAVHFTSWLASRGLNLAAWRTPRRLPARSRPPPPPPQPGPRRRTRAVAVPRPAPRTARPARHHQPPAGPHRRQHGHRPGQRAPATRRRAPAHRRGRPARPAPQDCHRLGPARRPRLGRLPRPARPAPLAGPQACHGRAGDLNAGGHQDNLATKRSQPRFRRTRLATNRTCSGNPSAPAAAAEMNSFGSHPPGSEMVAASLGLRQSVTTRQPGRRQCLMPGLCRTAGARIRRPRIEGFLLRGGGRRCGPERQ